MPGGLTRYQPAGGEALITLRHGGVTKDTWVLRRDGVDPAPLPPATALADLLTRAAETPSRLADNLFWLGRYLERTGQLAHLLVKLEPEAARKSPRSNRPWRRAQSGWPCNCKAISSVGNCRPRPIPS
jgi:hypothetical protein